MSSARSAGKVKGQCKPGPAAHALAQRPAQPNEQQQWEPADFIRPLKKFGVCTVQCFAASVNGKVDVSFGVVAPSAESGALYLNVFQCPRPEVEPDGGALCGIEVVSHIQRLHDVWHFGEFPDANVLGQQVPSDLNGCKEAAGDEENTLDERTSSVGNP